MWVRAAGSLCALSGPRTPRVIKSFEMELAPDRSQVGRARRFVVDIATMIGDDDLADIVELLTSEVVTNAVLHSRSESVRILVTWQPPTFRVEVHDDSARGPAVKRFGDEAATGRGLVLVEELAHDWGWNATDGGKLVWFEILFDHERVPAGVG